MVTAAPTTAATQHFKTAGSHLKQAGGSVGDALKAGWKTPLGKGLMIGMAAITAYHVAKPVFKGKHQQDLDQQRMQQQQAGMGL